MSEEKDPSVTSGEGTPEELGVDAQSSVESDASAETPAPEDPPADAVPSAPAQDVPVAEPPQEPQVGAPEPAEESQVPPPEPEALTVPDEEPQAAPAPAEAVQEPQEVAPPEEPKAVAAPAPERSESIVGDSETEILFHEEPPIEGEGGDEPEKKKKRGGIFIALLAVLLILGGVGVAVWSFWPTPPPEGGLTIYDMDNNVVIPDDESATDPEYLEKARMVEDDGGAGFKIPVVRLSVPLGSINEVNGVTNPPNFTSVFRIRNRGVDLDHAASGTIYLVGHAARQGRAPGNYVQANEQSILSPGDPILVDDLVYHFREALIIPQNNLGAHGDLWDDVPGRMIFITCLQLNNMSAPTHNLILVADLVTEE